MRLLIIFGLLLPYALPANAEEYWIAYEGNDFPENEGWTRIWFDPQAERWIEGGALVIDSRARTGGQVCEIDVSAANVTGQIEDMTISGDLATTNDVLCDNITGDVDIGGDLGKISLPHTKLSADTITGRSTDTCGVSAPGAMVV